MNLLRRSGGHPGVEPWFYITNMAIDVFIELFLGNSAFPSAAGIGVKNFMHVVEPESNRAQYYINALQEYVVM